MTDDHDGSASAHTESYHDEHDADRPDYDPESPEVPERGPTLRSTAPQSDYVMAQVGFGFLVLAIGLALTIGVALVLA